MVYYSLGPEKEQQQKHTGNNNKTVITHNHHTTLSGVLFAYSILLLTCLEYLIFTKIFICTRRRVQMANVLDSVAQNMLEQ